MKLFVDDIRPVPDESWTLARTVLTAIRAIEQFRPEEVSLDHDISHGELYPQIACQETFESVAWYIYLKATTQDYKPNVRLHTANSYGAGLMAQLLIQAGVKVTIFPAGYEGVPKLVP